jgi:hypothetical protein
MTDLTDGREKKEARKNPGNAKKLERKKTQNVS